MFVFSVCDQGEAELSQKCGSNFLLLAMCLVIL